MILVNFAHPLSDVQKQEVERLASERIDRIVDIPTRFDDGRAFADQARDLVETVGLSAVDWQQLPLLLNLPSLSVIAALVLAHIHGRTGHFPAILRLRPTPGTAVAYFEVAEILNLQTIRNETRLLRSQGN